MSYKYHKENVDGVCKVKWDGLWHVLYSSGTLPYHMDVKNHTYDRVTEKEARFVLKMISKWRIGKCLEKDYANRNCHYLPA